MASAVVYVRLSEVKPVREFLGWLQDDFYPRLNTEAPGLKTDFEDALARLFADCIVEGNGEPS
jgi:hypothetical protein